MKPVQLLNILNHSAVMAGGEILQDFYALKERLTELDVWIAKRKEVIQEKLENEEQGILRGMLEWESIVLADIERILEGK